jgi:hypothetical protein
MIADTALEERLRRLEDDRVARNSLNKEVEKLEKLLIEQKKTQEDTVSVVVDECAHHDRFYVIYRGLAVTSSTDVRHVGGIFSHRAGRFNGNNVKKRLKNRPFDRNGPMHLIKPGLRHQDLEGIHLPSFGFSWTLKKLLSSRFFCF